jgi:hypothetical protein
MPIKINPAGSTNTAYDYLVGVADQTSDNLFSDYDNPYNFESIKGLVDQQYTDAAGRLNRETEEDIATQTRGAAARAASQGITGGSILNNSMNQIGYNLNKKKYNALADLDISKTGQLAELQKYFNALNFQKTAAEQAQENAIYGQKLSGANALGDYSLNMENFKMMEANQPSTLEDIMAGVKDAAQIAASIAAVASDIRVKRNLKKVDVQNGFNIYEFNYIGSDKLYKGVVAQEVEQIMPEAVVEIGGIKHVLYSKIGINFGEV